MEEIRRLVVNHARHMNGKDFGAYARLFAEDGEWFGRPCRAVGHAALQEMVQGRSARSWCRSPTATSISMPTRR
jgi:ketosteroid isomerase-like protein